MSAPFTIHIPEEGYQKLIEFLDKEFPHCKECGGRFMPRVRESAAVPDASFYNLVCDSCLGTS